MTTKFVDSLPDYLNNLKYGSNPVMDKTINALAKETDKYLLDKKLEIGKQRAEKLGLEDWRLEHPEGGAIDCYPADDVHRLLGEGVELFGQCHGTHRNSSWTTDEKPSKQEWGLAHTHAGLLIGIKPIAPPSEERQIIQALVNCWSANDHRAVGEAYEMAKAYLAKTKK